MKVWLDGLLLAFQFLTTVPIRRQISWDPSRAKASLTMYPITGLLLGALLATVYVVIEPYVSLSLIVLLLITLSVLYTGGLHLDGWMDMSDAFLSRRSKDEKLQILKDPRVGAFAVLTTIFLLGWRFLFLFEILADLGRDAWPLLIIIPLMTRLAILYQLIIGNVATTVGMAASLKPFATRSVKFATAGWTMLTVIYLLVFLSPFVTVLFISSMILFYWLWMNGCKKQIGGMTGDTIGGSVEGGETVLWAVLWILLFFVTG